MRPALVAVAHGTRDDAGPEVVADLLADVRRRLPGVDVITAWVELLTPGLREVMSGMERPAVVVPLLLSTGYHVSIDLPAAAALSPAPVHIAAPLGPDRHLARATTARLREAGALWGDAVVLAAAGSTDPAGLAAVERALAQATPVIWNSDQGSHFTSPQYLALLQAAAVRISTSWGPGLLIWTSSIWLCAFCSAVAGAVPLESAEYTFL